MHIHLYDQIQAGAIQAFLSPLKDQQIQSLCESWAVSFAERNRHAHIDEDAWMWTTGAKNLLLLVHRRGMHSFVVMADHKIQGVILFGIELRHSRIDPQQQLVYVNYVATAPWNRADANGVRRLRGVGTTLMKTAVWSSFEQGCEGRLGLHSLQSSDVFYVRLGLRNLGPDAAQQGMNYYELLRASNMNQETFSHEAAIPA